MLDTHARAVALVDDATAGLEDLGVCHHDFCSCPVNRDADEHVRRCIAALRSILRLHQPTAAGTTETLTCAADGHPWPCPTIEAVDRS